MYTLNGIVYGEQQTDFIKVISVKALHDMILLLTFSTGETRLFDATILTGEAFEPLKNEKIFMFPAIEYGVVTWKNGEIDCAPEFMYENSYDYPAVCAMV